MMCNIQGPEDRKNFDEMVRVLVIAPFIALLIILVGYGLWRLIAWALKL
jgi:hypothetical protein